MHPSIGKVALTNHPSSWGGSKAEPWIHING